MFDSGIPWPAAIFVSPLEGELIEQFGALLSSPISSISPMIETLLGIGDY
jgi:hypothetical protein